MSFVARSLRIRQQAISEVKSGWSAADPVDMAIPLWGRSSGGEP